MITPICYKCKKELDDYGAILLSDPEGNEENPMTVLKIHLCCFCYQDVLAFIKEDKCDS